MEDLLLRRYKFFDLPEQVADQYSHFAIAHVRNLVVKRYLAGLDLNGIRQKIVELRQSRSYRRCLVVCSNSYSFFSPCLMLFH